MENKKKIKVYSSPDCMYCYTVKGYLEDNGFEYEEINIYDNAEEYEKMVEFSGQKNVPVTVIGEEVLVGWDKEKFKKVLGI
jgi:NADH-dependent peroxiredoxin subunit F